MKLREFKKIYHPRMGRYVYKHRGNGLIVDTLMKPLKSILGNVVKPFAKKAVKAGVSHAGEKVGKAAANKGLEKSGDVIRKRLSQMNSKREQRERSSGNRVTKGGAKKTQNDVNVLINNLIARP